MTEGVYLRGINPLLLQHDLKSNQFYGFDFSYEKDEILYNINEFGYRGEAFRKNVDLLALGCSNTIGLGIPKECSWPELVKSEKISTVDTIAACGDSAMGQVIKFFQYIKIYGNPKNVVAIFPVYRMEFPLQKNKWEISKEWEKYTQIHRDRASIAIHSPDDYDFKKYSKAPYDPNNLITKDISSYFTHIFIDILDTYCENNNINFKFSIYDHDYRIYNLTFDNYEGSLLQYMLDNYKNYFSWLYPETRFILSEEEINLNCHQEFNKVKYFYRAIDYIPNKSEGHWGLHQNLHIAEAVKKALFEGFNFYKIKDF